MNNPPPNSRLSEYRISGTEVHYYVLCPRKLWWFTHGMEQEHVDGSVGQENVALGSLLHETSYPAQTRKEVMIDNLLRLDFTDDGVVHEIKKSKGAEKASLYQLLYYLYYLKHVKGIETTGMIDYPQQKRRTEAALTPKYEADLERIIDGVVAVRAMPEPPLVPEPMPVCKMCAYQELCWG
jgi:CRISPR-associated exonuclease Cas4